MARVKRIDNSRKAHVCGRGGHEIPKGDSYLTASPGYRGRPKYRCLQHPFRASELTTSAASEPLAAVEAFEDAAADGFENFTALQEAWDELVQAVEEYRDMRQEGLDQWEYGNSQLEELLDTAQAALDEVEGHSITDEAEPDEPEDEPDREQEPEVWETWNEMRQEREEWEQSLADAVDEALSVAGSLEF